MPSSAVGHEGVRPILYKGGCVMIRGKLVLLRAIEARDLELCQSLFNIRISGKWL